MDPVGKELQNFFDTKVPFKNKYVPKINKNNKKINKNNIKTLIKTEK